MKPSLLDLYINMNASEYWMYINDHWHFMGKYHGYIKDDEQYHECCDRCCEVNNVA